MTTIITKVTLFLVVSLHLCFCMYKTVMEFDRYEIEYSVLGDFSKVRIRKYNRTTPVINGSYDLIVDLDDTYLIGLSCARSELGNNQYNQFPMKLSAMPVCQFIKTYGPDYQWIWQNNSNFPFVPPEGLCPWKKGIYWVKDLALDGGLIPPVIPGGYYRCYFDLHRVSTKEMVHHQAYYVRITKELMKM